MSQKKLTYSVLSFYKPATVSLFFVTLCFATKTNLAYRLQISAFTLAMVILGIVIIHNWVSG